jgi:lysophospholipase L1-like esterase
VPAIDPAETAESYARNVAALARLAAPAPVWVALQPVVATMRKPLAAEEQQTLAEKEQTVAGYAARVRATYRLMAERVRAAGLPLIDLNDALGAEPQLMFADECHFGDEAADRLARGVAAAWADQPRSVSSSSRVRGQSSFKRRESARSASSLPPVWQRGQ